MKRTYTITIEAEPDSWEEFEQEIRGIAETYFDWCLSIRSIAETSP